MFPSGTLTFGREENSQGAPFLASFARSGDFFEPPRFAYPRLLFYAEGHSGFCFETKSMQRLTAKLLLIFALVGTIVPIAMAVTTPPHACCVRKTHHCHESASPESTQLAFTAKTCDHDCCRAVSTSKWADLRLGISPAFVQNIAPRAADSQPQTPALELTSSTSPRAPPQFSIA
jgi:hypothetical protein